MPPPRTRMTGVIPRRAQVLDRGGLSDWPDSSSKTIHPPRSRRRPFIWPQVWVFHTSMAPSSRSIARRAPIWHDQPRRRSRYQIPGMVYCTANLRATRSRIGRVHRWSPSLRPAARPPAPTPAGPAAAHPAGTAPPALRCQPGRAACQPRLPPPPHRPLGHPQLSSNLRSGPAARTSPRPPAGPASGACGPRQLTRHLAHTAYLLHTPGNRARQPHGHPE